MAGFRFDATGSAAAISTAGTAFLATITAQPDLTAATNAVAMVNAMTAAQGRSNYVVAIFGDAGLNNTGVTIQVFAVPNLGTGF